MPKTKLKKLFDKAWKLMSQYIKLRDSDWRGYAKCCSCGKTIEAFTSKAHAGHYRHGYLDFNEVNINLQCNHCNTFKGGQLDTYTLFLTRKHGIEVIEELDKAFHEHKLKHDQTGKKYTEQELLDTIELLKEKINELKQHTLIRKV